MTSLKVKVVQTGQIPADMDAAWAGLEADFIRYAEGYDVVVFPELATTPYFGCTGDDQYRAWAEPVDGERVARLAATAKSLQTGLVFGFYEAGEDGRLYNSAVLIDADGEIVQGLGHDGLPRSAYRKTAIPQGTVGESPVNEKQFFEPGDGVVTFDFCGAKVAVLICYDRTFPEYWIAARQAGAEVVFALVSSMGFRETLFVQELQVRALETQVWIVAANRGGTETIAGLSTDYFGLSTIITPDARVIAQAPAHQAGVTIEADLDLAEVARVRDTFQLGRDRTPEMFRYVLGTLEGAR